MLPEHRRERPVQAPFAVQAHQDSGTGTVHAQPTHPGAYLEESIWLSVLQITEHHHGEGEDDDRLPANVVPPREVGLELPALLVLSVCDGLPHALLLEDFGALLSLFVPLSAELSIEGKRFL